MRVTFIILLSTLSGQLAAEAQPASQPGAIDIALTSEGDFVSQCQDETERPLVGIPVQLIQDGNVVAVTHSEVDGWFQFREISPGSYQLTTEGWSNPIRLWTAEDAPPAAQEPIIVILESRTQPITTDDRTRAEDLDPQPAAALDPQPKALREAPPVEEEEQDLPTIELAFAGEETSESVGADGAQGDRPIQKTGFRQQGPPNSGDDAVFNPFYDSYPMQPAPADAGPPWGEPAGPVGPAMGPAGNAAAPVFVEPGPNPGCPPGVCPPGYPVGPTVGDVVLGGIGIGAITVGAIAIYKYDQHEDRVRRVVSP